MYIYQNAVYRFWQKFPKKHSRIVASDKSVVGSVGSVVYMEYIGSGIYKAWLQSLFVPFTSSVAGPTQIHSLWASISAAVEWG